MNPITNPNPAYHDLSRDNMVGTKIAIPEISLKTGNFSFVKLPPQGMT
jgi:hypothetical protein